MFIHHYKIQALISSKCHCTISLLLPSVVQYHQPSHSSPVRIWLEEACGFAHEVSVGPQSEEAFVVDDDWELTDENNAGVEGLESREDAEDGIVVQANDMAASQRCDIVPDPSVETTVRADPTEATANNAASSSSSRITSGWPLPEFLRGQDEDYPDPFTSALPKEQLVITPANVTDHHHDPIFILYKLVAWLHTQFHVPFRACHVVLVVVCLVLQAAGFPIKQADIYISLSSVLSFLGVAPLLTTWPVCPSCLEVHPHPLTGPAFDCTNCGATMFDTEPTPAQKLKGHTLRKEPRPLLQFPT